MWALYIAIGVVVGFGLAWLTLRTRSFAETATSGLEPQSDSADSPTNLTEPQRNSGEQVKTDLIAQTRGQLTSDPVAPGLDERTKRMLGALQLGICLVDRNDVLYTNPMAERMRLVRRGQIRHPKLRDLVASTITDQSADAGEFSISAGPFQPELTVHASAHYLSHNQALLIVEDTSESRRVEAVRRDFTVNVSHELKTPVGAISLLAETILGAPEDAEMVQRFATRMHTEAQRLAALVQDIMDLSRLQDGGSQLDMKPVRIADIIHEAKAQALTGAQAKELSLVVGDLPDVQVLAQASLLITALRNLIDNAVNYSEPNTRVAIGALIADQHVKISVVDQGMGIPEADLERIFERFYRVDAARARKTGGTGLGLSIVKHIIADHGGTINVWSKVNHGTTFTITLPLHSTGENE